MVVLPLPPPPGLLAFTKLLQSQASEEPSQASGPSVQWQWRGLSSINTNVPSVAGLVTDQSYFSQYSPQFTTVGDLYYAQQVGGHAFPLPTVSDDNPALTKAVSSLPTPLHLIDLSLAGKIVVVESTPYIPAPYHDILGIAAILVASPYAPTILEHLAEANTAVVLIGTPPVSLIPSLCDAFGVLSCESPSASQPAPAPLGITQTQESLVQEAQDLITDTMLSMCAMHR